MYDFMSFHNDAFLKVPCVKKLHKVSQKTVEISFVRQTVDPTCILRILINFVLHTQFQFVSEIANFSPFSTGKKSSLSSPGLKAQFKGCLGLNRVPSTPYLASDSKKGMICVSIIIIVTVF